MWHSAERRAVVGAVERRHCSVGITVDRHRRHRDGDDDGRDLDTGYYVQLALGADELDPSG